MPRKALVLARAALWFAQKAAGEGGRMPTAPNLTDDGMGRAQMRSAWDGFFYGAAHAVWGPARIPKRTPIAHANANADNDVLAPFGTTRLDAVGNDVAAPPPTAPLDTACR